ncbi:MAG TPA: BON domain-containing protein [Psychrobacter sp.]|uniref:BON domain-containing protein n=1 Tax=Psychrobacter sp. TaxID=56811 RepID=UPI002C9E4B4F|nr:BON domain-containing protein [Psychrobacter sp.]HSP85652.1 BON domain-containing protein [Psychrobacter sp.]
MTRMHLRTAILSSPRRTAISVMLMSSIVTTGCTTNYLTNSTQGTYGVPMTERTIPQRLLDRSIEHTVKINVYGLQESLQQTSRMSIDSFNSIVLLTGEVPTEAVKAEISKVVGSMPDVRQVYNELTVGASKGYSQTVHDGYITSKLMAKIATADGVKASQIKAVTNNGVVYVMGRMTPTQQSHLIDIANSTVGITELVLLTTVVDDRGVKLGNDDIMYEANLADSVNPNRVAVVNNVSAPNTGSSVTADTTISATPIIVTEDGSPVTEPSSSPYIDLYQTP